MKTLIVVCLLLLLLLSASKRTGNAQSSLAEFYITEVGLPFVHSYNFTSKFVRPYLRQQREQLGQQSHHDSFCRAQH